MLYIIPDVSRSSTEIRTDGLLGINKPGMKLPILVNKMAAANA
jgi:hypothetical protein